MKIAHLYQSTNIDFSHPQAAHLHIYYTIRGLQTVGHSVSLLAPQGRGVLFSDDLEVFKCSDLSAKYQTHLGITSSSIYKLFESGFRRFQSELQFPYLGFFDSFRLYDACKNLLPGWDLIHERYNLLAIGGALASRRLGIPLVLEVNADLLAQREFRGYPEKGLRKIVAHWATQYCFKTAASIICISHELADHIHQKWDVPEDKIKVLPCAADVEAFRPNKPYPDLRPTYKLTDEPVIMWIGGFYEWHDLDLLIDSFIFVLKRHPNARLILVGDGNTYAAIERKINENNFQDQILLTGAIAHNRIPEYLNLADIVVSPSPALPPESGGTGTPLKLFEYMAAGKPIVATTNSQTTAVIRNGENGLLVPARDAAAFSNAIVELIEDPSLRTRLANTARAEAENQYSWEEYSRQLEAIYLDVI